MDIMTHVKFHFNLLMLTLILASGPLRPPSGLANDWPDNINSKTSLFLSNFLLIISQSKN